MDVKGHMAIEPGLPVFVVIGPHAGALFPSGVDMATIRRDAGALWVAVKSAEALAGVMTQIKKTRGRYPDAALLPVLPDADEDAELRQEFAAWRHALGAAQCCPGHVMACHVAFYACLDDGAAAAEPRWLGDGVVSHMSERPNALSIRRALAQLRQRVLARTGSQARRDALSLAMLEWLNDLALLTPLESLTNTSPLALHGVLLCDGGRSPPRSRAWSRWLVERTGLEWRRVLARQQILPLPHIPSASGDAPLASALDAVRSGTDGSPPRLRRRTGKGLSKWLRPALAGMLLAVWLFGAMSFWRSYQLLDSAARNLTRYRAMPAEQLLAKCFATAALKSDRDILLDSSTSLFDLGLYRGEEALRRVEAALSSYQPPSTNAWIDSLSLFRTGQAILQPGEDGNGSLQRMLRLIHANPEFGVLITGHTDSTGDARTNWELSQARARAVYRWFVDQGVAPARLRVEGHGDALPRADNASEAGRALNRRVEISMLPPENLNVMCDVSIEGNNVENINRR